MPRLVALVKGRVQGVGYRAFAQKKALVQAEAEGVATVLTLSVALMVAFQILIGG